MMRIVGLPRELEILTKAGYIKHIHVTHLEGVSVVENRLAMVYNAKAPHADQKWGRLHCQKKARKSTTCQACQKPIEIGNYYGKRTNHSQGQSVTTFCLSCGIEHCFQYPVEYFYGN